MKLKLALFLAATSLSIIASAAPPVDEGKAIFTARCAGCHNIHKPLTGPALAGVDQRRSLDWIIDFVHSSQSVIKKGDKEAIALFKQFNNIPMPDHTDLTAAQIGNVVEYIKSETNAPTQKEVKNEDKPVSTYLPIELRNYGFLLIFFSLLVLLVGVVLFAIKVNRYKKAYYQKG